MEQSMRWKRRLFHEEIVKWSVIKIIRLQIYVIALEINENIKPFEEIVTNHTVYVFFTLHPGREGRKCTSYFRHYIRANNHFIKKYIF